MDQPVDVIIAPRCTEDRRWWVVITVGYRNAVKSCADFLLALMPKYTFNTIAPVTRGEGGGSRAVYLGTATTPGRHGFWLIDWLIEMNSGKEICDNLKVTWERSKFDFARQEFFPSYRWKLEMHLNVILCLGIKCEYELMKCDPLRANPVANQAIKCEIQSMSSQFSFATSTKNNRKHFCRSTKL